MSGGEMRLQCEGATCWTVMELLCHAVQTQSSSLCKHLLNIDCFIMHVKFNNNLFGSDGLDDRRDGSVSLCILLFFSFQCFLCLPLSVSQMQWIWVPRMSWWISRRWMKGCGQAVWGLTWPHPPSRSATASPRWTWGPRPWRSVGSAGAPARTRKRALWQQAGPPARTQSCLSSDWRSLPANQCPRQELSPAWHAPPALSSLAPSSRWPVATPRPPATTPRLKLAAIRAACRRKGWGTWVRRQTTRSALPASACTLALTFEPFVTPDYLNPRLWSLWPCTCDLELQAMPTATDHKYTNEHSYQFPRHSFLTSLIVCAVKSACCPAPFRHLQFCQLPLLLSLSRVSSGPDGGRMSGGYHLQLQCFLQVHCCREVVPG